MANKFWPATSRTGGGGGALDGIDGSDLTAGDGCIVIMSTFFGVYRATTSASTENDPGVIVPDVNAGSWSWELL